MTIADGQTEGSAFIGIDVTADTEKEGEETFIVSGAAAGLTVSSAVFKIEDDDDDIRLVVSQNSLSEGLGTGQVTVEAQRSTASSTEQTVTLSLGGTATESSDYTQTGTASITIAANAKKGSTQLTFNLEDDEATEGNETIIISGTTSGTDTVGDAVIVLLDNEYNSIKPGKPTVTRTEYSGPSNPGLDASLTAPASGDGSFTHYQARYCKQGDTQWTTHSETPQKSATSVTMPDMEAGATYYVQVRAIKNGEDFGGWSSAGAGQANRPPYGTGWGYTNWTINWGAHGVAGIGGHFDDDDGDELTYTVESDYPGILKAWIEEDSPTLGVQAHNPSVEAKSVRYKAHDGYGGVSTPSVLSVNVVANEVRYVAENTLGNTLVGRPVVGNSYDIDGVDGPDETYTHTLTGGAASHFQIDSTTGQISRNGTSHLDYESTPSFTGKVEWTVQEQAVAANLTINVIDLAPGKPGTPDVRRIRFDEPTAPALYVYWADADANGTTLTGYNVRYRKDDAVNDANEPVWTDYKYLTDPEDSTTETDLLLPSINAVELMDLVAGATYEAQVRAVSSEEGKSDWTDTGSGTANRPPTASSISFLGGSLGMGGSFAWHEAAPLGSGAFFTDPDGDTLTYSASAEKPALIGVSVSGEPGSAVLTANLLNQGAASKVNYTASDSYGGQVTRSANITVTAKTSREIAENSPAGAVVGDPVTGTPYNGVALTYTLSGKAKDSGLFVIDSATGQISVATGANIDYETDDTHREIELYNGEVFAKFYRGMVSYTVNGHASSIEVLIKVTDVDETKPTISTITRTKFSEPTDPALDVTWIAPTQPPWTVAGYNVQYRKQVAAGETELAWTAYSGTLSATDTTVNLPGLEARCHLRGAGAGCGKRERRSRLLV